MYKRTDELTEHVSRVVERGKKAGRIRIDIPTEDIVYSFGGMVMNVARILFHPAAGAVRFDAAEKARSINSILLCGVAAKKRTTA